MNQGTNASPSFVSFGPATSVAQPDTGTGELAAKPSTPAESRQTAEGVFEYSPTWRLVPRLAAIALMVLAVGHLALVTITTVRSGAGMPLGLLNARMVGAVLGVALSAGLAAVVVNLLPALRVTPENFAVAEANGWRTIPWDQVGTLQVMEMRTTGRYLIMVPVQGAKGSRTTAPMLEWIPALVGSTLQGTSGGVLFTSDIVGFEQMLRLMVVYMGNAAGQAVPTIEAFVDETIVMPVAQLFLEPLVAIERLSKVADTATDFYGASVQDEPPAIPWNRVLVRQLMIACAPALFLVLEVLTRAGDRPVAVWQATWPIVLLGLGVFELPFVAWLVQSVGELMLGTGRFDRALWAHLEFQLPRVLLVIIAAALVASGAPIVFSQLLWLLGVGITTMLLLRFTQRLYLLPAGQTLLAGTGAAIFQIAIFAVYFGVR